MIRIPLQEKPSKSSSGKTLVVATSGGNQVTQATYEGKNIIVGFTAYIKPDKN